MALPDTNERALRDIKKNVNQTDQIETSLDEGDQQRENLFLLLKRAIKARGYTYSKLAQAMNMSELSIKRLFKEKDCKMSRLLEICRIIGLSIDELVNMQQRFKDTPEYLSEEVETALEADKYLFLFFILLVSKIDLASAQESLNFNRTELYLHLRKLENLELIRLLGDDKYCFTVSLPIRWRINGALSKRIKSINQSYIAHCLDKEDHPDYVFSTSSRLMTENSTQQIQKSLCKVREEYDYLSTQDQMFYPREDLQLTKLVFGMGPFPIDVMLTDK